MALLARKHGSWLVTLGIKAEVVTVLVESPAAVKEMVLFEVLKAEEERAVEQATKTHTKTLKRSPMTRCCELDRMR